MGDCLLSKQSGDHVIALHGQIEARPGSTNLVKVITVS
jgi:hypothetical protein